MSVKSKIQAIYDLIQMQFIKNKAPFKVKSIESTLQDIKNKKLSVSRYGDDEVLMMANQMHESFQSYNEILAKKLKHIISNPISNHMVCIPDIFDDLTKYNEVAMSWFRYFLARKKYLYYKFFDINQVYGNSYITRCYMDRLDKTDCPKYFAMLKNIWADKDIVFIEGEFSRLGVGNDLLDRKSVV